jgi:hypothetical protein
MLPEPIRPPGLKQQPDHPANKQSLYNYGGADLMYPGGSQATQVEVRVFHWEESRIIPGGQGLCERHVEQAKASCLGVSTVLLIAWMFFGMYSALTNTRRLIAILWDIFKR